MVNEKRRRSDRGDAGHHDSPFPGIFGLDPQDLDLSAVDTIKVGVRELHRLLGTLTIYRLLHDPRIHWLTFLMAQSTPVPEEQAFWWLRNAVRECDACIVMLVCKIAKDPVRFKRIVTNKPEALFDTVKILAGLVVRMGDDANYGLCSHSLRNLREVGVSHFVRPLQFYLEGGLGVSPRTFVLAGILGSLTSQTFGRLALPSLRTLIAQNDHIAARAYTSASICTFEPRPDIERDLIKTATERGNSFACHAVTLLGCIGSAVCVGELKKLKRLEGNDGVASEARRSKGDG